ncbi:hypothetical protein ELE36_00910 [Pseudolysobacter antarcticus]|uniref:Efflux transporter periplasmic adaptor subunit n=1 Tax=Pseudolysobacter antarcticus TaxID=2511995 RepID=A0A411HEY8_9GAMM|nr:hypothetical protein [Pseudolysobacter antarcticus]QBB69055.1 hypothetical protein ELE36_00910 [Pseudolysobacter antarcticus]
MNMKMQLVRGTLALVMFASLGAWAVTHRVVTPKPASVWLQKTVKVGHESVVKVIPMRIARTEIALVDTNAE